MKEKIGNFIFWAVMVLAFAVVFAFIVGGMLSNINTAHNETIAEQSKTIEELELKNITLQEMLIDANNDYLEIAGEYWRIWSRVDELERLMREWEVYIGACFSNEVSMKGVQN